MSRWTTSTPASPRRKASAARPSCRRNRSWTRSPSGSSRTPRATSWASSRACKNAYGTRVPLLTGTRVLACENGLAGPLCSRLLADLGADVIKVERPGVGDVTRGWDSIAGGEASGFVWMNRGKRSVALDLKDDTSRPALEALIRASDVFLQNFTPGWAAVHGVDEPAVRSLRPDIVYTEISGYGPDGPYAERNAYDLVVQGGTGLISVPGPPGEPASVGVPR